MPARKLYFESVRVGDELPALAKAPVDRVQLARYAGASGDFNPVHVDETYAKSIGMPSVYAPGMLVMGFLGQLMSDWARGALLRSCGPAVAAGVARRAVCAAFALVKGPQQGAIRVEHPGHGRGGRGAHNRQRVCLCCEDEPVERQQRPPLLLRLPCLSLPLLMMPPLLAACLHS